MLSGEKVEVDFFGGYQNSHPMPALLPYHRLNIDRCMINIKHLMTGPEGNKIHCSPRRFQRSRATAVNIFAGNSELFPV